MEVLATDLSEDALELARAGRYGDGALRGLPAAMRDRWFRRDPRITWVDAAGNPLADVSAILGDW